MAQSTGIASPVTVDMGGTQVSFYPLGLAEWKEMELSLLHRRRQRHIQSVWEATEMLPDDLRKEMAVTAVEEAKQFDLAPVDIEVVKKTDGIVDLDSNGDQVKTVIQMDAVNAWVEQTYEGKMFAVWLSIRRGRPDITEQEVSDLLMSGGTDGMTSAFDAMLSASGMEDQGNEAGPSSRKKSSKGKAKSPQADTQKTST